MKEVVVMLERWRPTLGIRPWRPFGSLDEMERLMDDMLRRPPFGLRWGKEGETAWAPALEVYEKDDQFVVRAELPGVEKKDFKVTTTEDSLTIEGERKSETEVEEENYHRCEMSYGRFSRSLILPPTVDKSRIDAKYENGILELTLPKIPEPNPQEIEIEVK